MIGYPLDSRVTYDKDGIPIYDRAVTSAPLRKLTKSLFSDGVLPNPSTNLQVLAKGDKITIKAGFALCDGCQKLQEDDLELNLPEADNVNDRIDTVVLRLDNNEDVRSCEFYVIRGVAAASPIRPALSQTESIWEIGLADIRRKARSTEITDANITDTRYETARCGIISSISRFDTTTLYRQVQSDLEQFQQVSQAEFVQWFEDIRNVLSGDISGNLLNLINAVKEKIGELSNLKTTQKSNLVAAVNELSTTISAVSVSENNLASANTKTDLLDVDLTNPASEKNKVHKIATGDASTLSNSPITTGHFYGKWECIFHTNTIRVMVKITEFYPVPGRIWVNHYNYDKWAGWSDRFEKFIPKSDIVNNLTSTSTTAPLAASQGKNIKSLIDSNAIGDVYSNRFSQMIANGEKLYVVSNNINDTVHSGGRGFKRNSSEKVIIGRFGTEYWGYYIMGATQESLAYVDATENGELNNIGSFTTPLGNTVYVAIMKASWKPSTSNYVVVAINGIQHIIKERTFTSSNSLTTDIAKWILGIADAELFNDSTLQPTNPNNNIFDTIFDNLTNVDLKTNLLQVNLKWPNADMNKVHRINTSDASTLSNSPITSGQFIGKWECESHSISGDNSRVLVKITEYYPVAGRIWYNHYNWTGWTGWKNDATHSMVDSGSSIKANTTSGKVAGALGVKELYNELKAQFIPSDMKIEAGTITTSGETRTITLKGNYTKMLYFNIGNNENPLYPVFLPVGVKFTAPNIVTFNLKVYGNNGVDASPTGYATGYIFIGQ